MSRKPGCWKTTLFGCLGIVGLLIVVLGITILMAWSGLRDRETTDRTYTPNVEATTGRPAQGPTGPGRLVLDIGQCELEIKPAAPGAGLSLRAHYDAEVHELVDSYVVAPDSSWVYELRFRRTMPGMEALFRQLLGGESARIEVAIPPDLPIALEIAVREGGFAAEVGGLWITSTDIKYDRGGFDFDVSTPLQAPMEHLVIHGKMGGFNARNLGNASPQMIDIRTRMGGADIDLGGQWLNDADVRLSSSMGGMDVRLPDDVIVEGVPDAEAGLQRQDLEQPVPVLRVTSSFKMGGMTFR